MPGRVILVRTIGEYRLTGYDPDGAIIWAECVSSGIISLGVGPQAEQDEKQHREAA